MTAMIELFEQHPALTLIGFMLALVRVILHWTSPQLASFYGVLVGVPMTMYLFASHWRLRRDLKRKGWIR